LAAAERSGPPPPLRRQTLSLEQRPPALRLVVPVLLGSVLLALEHWRSLLRHRLLAMQVLGHLLVPRLPPLVRHPLVLRDAEKDLTIRM
jgi:hypothetical protein